MRWVMNQLSTATAFGAASISAVRLPVWSMSSWLMNTQRMSSGSTMENTSLRNCLAVLGHAGVDDDRFGAANHERDERNEDRASALARVIVGRGTCRVRFGWVRDGSCGRWASFSSRGLVLGRAAVAIFVQRYRDTSQM